MELILGAETLMKNNSKTVMGGNLSRTRLTANDAGFTDGMAAADWVGVFGIGAPYNAFATGYEAISA